MSNEIYFVGKNHASSQVAKLPILKVMLHVTLPSDIGHVVIR